MPDQKQPRDYWIKDNSIFFCDGQKYGIAKDGSTVCAGSVSGVTETPQDTKKLVAKLPIKGIGRELPQQPQKVTIMQHSVGRPRKEGPVHRTTKWRREKQGVLL